MHPHPSHRWLAASTRCRPSDSNAEWFVTIPSFFPLMRSILSESSTSAPERTWETVDAKTRKNIAMSVFIRVAFEK